MSPNSSKERYKKNLPRVSNIVEATFPFWWEDKQRFHDWLSNYKIRPDEYMEEASSWWTYVHKALEDYLDWKPFKWKKYVNFVNAWIQFIKDYWIVKVYTEHYICTQFFQWTIDLVWEDRDGNLWLLDWKTYWLAKVKYWLAGWVYRKPYSKLKKAAMQLSLYAMWIAESKEIKWIAVIELCEDGQYHFHELKRWDDAELMRLVLDYFYSYIDQI